MENGRTVAFQVPESLFQRLKDYLQRNNMSQRQFLLGLIEAVSDNPEQEDKVMSEDEKTACEGEEGGGPSEKYSFDAGDEPENESEGEKKSIGMVMGM